jgi:putative tricarboxylic transport membrane protein
MKGGRSQRLAGLACVLVAVAVALIARTFRVGFVTDPIGPRALPWLAAALLGLGGAVLALRPGAEPDWSPAGPTRRAIAATPVSFALYAILIGPLGFVLATTLLMTVLARMFGGRLVPGLLAGAAFSGVMWLLFVAGLGVPLPGGILFTRGG